MKDKNKFVKSIIKFSIGQWGAAVISFITVPVISWLIMPDEFGRASMFTLAVNLIRLAVLSGLDQSFTRKFYEKKEEERPALLWNSLVIPLFLSVLISIIAIICWRDLSLLLFDNDEEFYPVLILSLTVFISILERFAALVIRMKKEGWSFSILTFANKAVEVTITILYASLISKSFHALVWGSFISFSTTFIIALYLQRDFWKFSFRLDTKELKQLLHFGLPLLPSTLIFWALQSVDRIALRNYSTFNEIGIYQASFKLVAVLQLIQAGFTMFWTPISYESYEKNPESKSLYEKTAASMCALMFSLSLVLIFSKDFIFLFFSPAYRTASHVFPFLLLVPIMYIVSEITVVGINFTKKTYWHLLIAFVSSLIAIIGNWKLVPLYGAKGAAAAAAVSYTAFFYLRTIISKKLYPADYGLLKFSLSTFIFILVAFLNTFSENMSLNLISAGSGVLFIMLIYKDQLKDFRMIGKDLLSEKVFKRNMKTN